MKIIGNMNTERLDYIDIAKGFGGTVDKKES